MKDFEKSDAEFEATLRLADGINRSLADFANCAPLEDCHNALRAARVRYEAEVAALKASPLVFSRKSLWGRFKEWATR